MTSEFLPNAPEACPPTRLLPKIKPIPTPTFSVNYSHEARKNTYSSAEFPDPLVENAKLKLWGKVVDETHKRDWEDQPPLMPRHRERKFQKTIENRNILNEKYRAAAKKLATESKQDNFMSESPYFTGDRNEPTHIRNARKWKECQYLYYHISQPGYRSGSMENAMWQLSNKKIGKDVFVQAVVSEFRFDRKLRMEEHLERLYDAFDNAWCDSVDYRLILCSYLNLVLFKTIKENPRHLFFLMFDIFTEPFSDEVPRGDVLDLISLCACTEDEFKETRNRLNKGFRNLSAVHGLKPNFQWVQKALVMEVFEVDPGLLLNFAEQCWARLSEDQRLYVLGKKEEESAMDFAYRDHKFKTRQALQLWTRALLAKSFRSWESYKEESLRIRGQRLWMLYRAAKRRLRQWRKRTEFVLARRERLQIARAMGKLIVKRSKFLRWKTLVVTQLKLMRASNKFDKKFQRYADGLGHLRYGYYRWKARLLLERWDDETKYMQRWNAAIRWNRAKFKEANWKAFKTYIKQCLTEKNKELDAIDRQNWLGRLMKEADEDLAELKRKQDEESFAKAIKAEEEEASDRLRRKMMMNQRKKAQRGADDRLILEMQREERRLRVENERQKLKEEYEEFWVAETEKMLSEAKEKRVNWMNNKKDKEAKEKLLKAFKNLKRDFYQPPTIENKRREELLNNEAMIALSIIDGKMFDRGVLGEELFETFDESGDGFITYEEFRNSVHNLDIDIEHSWLRSIVKRIDVEGDGYISVEELSSAMEKTYEFHGVQGSPWKMYVNIAQQILQYHNVITGQQVFEHNMTDKILKQIVRDNIIADTLVNERKRILRKKRKDWELRNQHWAARKMQRMYYRHVAHIEISKHRWKLQQAELAIMRRKERKVALMWQTAFRRKVAKRRAWNRVQLHYEKKVDVENGGKLYYYNHLTGDRTWEKPGLFFLFLGMDEHVDLDEPLPWSLQYREDGCMYWFNRLTREVIEGDMYGNVPDKPSGYPLCLNCNMELAWKSCKQCQFDYCFQCYRMSHNFLGADKHTWTMVEPSICSLCHKNIAAKNAKGKDFCKTCFERLDKSGVFRGKNIKIFDI